MFSWATISALLQALPQILRLFQSVADYAAVKQGEGKGRAEATAEALEIGAAQIDLAAKARADAAADHAAHPTDDGGFDSEFQRKS